MTRLFVDADACPVKDEIYKVALRYALQTFVVANSFIQIPNHPLIERLIVDAGPDAADDWIAERCRVGDIVITQDIPLADRALKAGAQAIGNQGKPFTRDSIGSALAGREIGEHLRAMGVETSGPRAFAASDRSRFLQELDAAVHRAKRALALDAAKRG
jgi:uncharacterized protein YaiI (UPF0178 family)